MAAGLGRVASVVTFLARCGRAPALPGAMPVPDLVETVGRRRLPRLALLLALLLAVLFALLSTLLLAELQAK